MSRQTHCRGLSCNSSHMRSYPIPWAVSFDMAFLPDNLTEEQYLGEVRRIVRDRLPSLQHEWEAPALFDEYDQRVSSIIEEELARN